MVCREFHQSLVLCAPGINAGTAQRLVDGPRSGANYQRRGYLTYPHGLLGGLQLLHCVKGPGQSIGLVVFLLGPSVLLLRADPHDGKVLSPGRRPHSTHPGYGSGRGRRFHDAPCANGHTTILTTCHVVGRQLLEVYDDGGVEEASRHAHPVLSHAAPGPERRTGRGRNAGVRDQGSGHPGTSRPRPRRERTVGAVRARARPRGRAGA